MKPIEHPEFFRLPPPAGSSRESTIVLDQSGRFWHEGQLVSHPGLQRGFASWLRRHPDDGRYILCNGYDWTYLRVEGTPFFVHGLRAEGETLLLTLSDGSVEPLEADTLRVGPDEALVARVKQGAFEARFTPAAQAALVPYVAESPAGEPLLALGGREYRILAATK
jgi:uncharacterized protein